MKYTALVLGFWGVLSLLLAVVMVMNRQATPQPASIIFLKSYNRTSHMYRMWRDGTGERRITYELAPQDVLHSFVWSPTGRNIIFVKDNRLYSLDAQGGKPYPVTSTIDQTPTWSPDGRFLTFASNREGNWDIYRLEWNTGDLLRLTSDPAEDTNPIWLPDGQTILFDTRRSGSKDIYQMDWTGENQTLMLTLKENLTVKGWAADGTRLYFDRGINWCWAYYWQEKRLDEITCREMERHQRTLAPALSLPLHVKRILSGGIILLTFAGFSAYLNYQDKKPLVRF